LNGGRIPATFAGSAVVVALAIVFWLPPEGGFYPVCPIHALTGTLCPGCGGTRALHALLHGRVSVALHFNSLITIAALPAVAFAILQCVSLWRVGSFRAVNPPPALRIAACILVATFWIARNVVSV